MALKSPNSKKRFSCEIPSNPIKILKTLTKENVPPEDVESSIDSSDADGFHQKLYISGGGTPKKNSQLKEEPMTPHANIKLLTSLAATRDYANCATPKSRKSNESPIVNFENVTKPSRKDRSLALVCSRFLEIYPLDPDPGINIVSLDEVTYKLGVERRRLYDIVNVFESVDMLRKQAKNRYLWFGKSNLVEALRRIKIAGLVEGIKEKLEYVLQFEKSVNPLKHKCMLDDVQHFNQNLSAEDNDHKDRLCDSPIPEFRKEKSLAIMSQKFLMLFLVSPSTVISLSAAAKVLNGIQKKGAQIKTQIRRLYDIANVLTSIGLIRKEVTKECYGRKPSFQYTGPSLEGEGVNNNPSKISSNKVKPKSFSRHPSFQEICEAAEVEHQKLFQCENQKSSCVENNISFSTNYINLNHDIKDSKENIKTTDPSPSTQYDNTTGKPSHIITLQLNQNMKIIKLPRSLLSDKNNTCYVLDSANIPFASYLKENVVLVPINQSSNAIQVKSTENQGARDQAVMLSPLQREAILKSLNITLAPNEIALINLVGNAQSSNDNPNSQCNTLKIINKNSEEVITENKCSTAQNVYIIKNLKIDHNYQKQNVSSSFNSTRNNSPSDNNPRLDSPLSIPSGYATPIPSSSSDIIFASNSDVDCYLKKIESTSSYLEYINKCRESLLIENVIYSDLTPKIETKENSILKGSCETNFIHTENDQDVPQIADSCSSESLNAEVSNILKEVPFGETATKNKGFLIDEKTILSPIKKPNGAATSLTPSPLMTPPYLARDKVFQFNSSINFQNVHGIKILKSQPIQVYSKSNNKFSPLSY